MVVLLNTICGLIIIGLSLSFVSKHNMCRIMSSVNTICGRGRIMIGLSLLSSVSKHNMWLLLSSVSMWSCYLGMSFVSKHNMWSYYHWVVVVIVHQYMWSYYDWVVVVVVLQ